MNEEYIFKKLSEMYGVSEKLIERIDSIFGNAKFNLLDMFILLMFHLYESSLRI